MGVLYVWLLLYIAFQVYIKKTYIQSVYNVTVRKLKPG